MNRIVQLDKSVAEKIAAGEVVERPASAVKELLENAIDAGATAVTLEIQNGGVAFIRVTDNGGGILREDMPLAFARHATSKVRSAQDLDSIATLGFRGEALASISAVSHVEMLTRTANEVCGSRIEVDGGTIGVPQDAGCPQGTTVIVRELFYNTPARMKFLKKDVSEGNAVATVAERIALSHPEVSVKFIRDGRVQLHTPGDNKLISAIYGVFGRSFASSLIPADYELSGVKVGGYVSKPVDSRGSRSMQIFYINGRLVRSKTAVAAIEEAYKGSVMTGRYPACVLTLSLSPALVDVNVHPAKLEVRFANEKQIFDAVYYAAKNALASLDTRPEMELKQRREDILRASLSVSAPAPSTGGPAASSAASLARFADKPKPQLKMDLPRGPWNGVKENADVLESTVRAVYTPIARSKPTDNSAARFAATSGISAARPEGGRAAGKQEVNNAAPQVSEQSGSAITDYRIIGQCFGTYFIVEAGQELLLIDKHAAHERIIYEQLKKDAQAASQQLLEPVTVSFVPEEYQALKDCLGMLAKAGFAAEDFGGTTLIVRAAPSYLAPGEIAGVLGETAASLVAGKKDVTPQKLDDLYHSVACRAAVKAGDKTGPEEEKRLVARILEFGDIRYCPHGRPVAMVIKRAEIEKQFGRRG